MSRSSYRTYTATDPNATPTKGAYANLEHHLNHHHNQKKANKHLSGNVADQQQPESDPSSSSLTHALWAYLMDNQTRDLAPDVEKVHQEYRSLHLDRELVSANMIVRAGQIGVATYLYGLIIIFATTFQFTNWQPLITTSDIGVDFLIRLSILAFAITSLQFLTCEDAPDLVHYILAPFMTLFYAPEQGRQRLNIVGKSIWCNAWYGGFHFGAMCLAAYTMSVFNLSEQGNIAYPIHPFIAGQYKEWMGYFTLIMIVVVFTYNIHVHQKYCQVINDPKTDLRTHAKMWHWNVYTIPTDKERLWSITSVCLRFSVFFLIYKSPLDLGLLLATTAIYPASNGTDLGLFVSAIVAGIGALLVVVMIFYYWGLRKWEEKRNDPSQS